MKPLLCDCFVWTTYYLIKSRYLPSSALDFHKKNCDQSRVGRSIIEFLTSRWFFFFFAKRFWNIFRSIASRFASSFVYEIINDWFVIRREMIWFNSRSDSWWYVVFHFQFPKSAISSEYLDRLIWKGFE